MFNNNICLVYVFIIIKTVSTANNTSKCVKQSKLSTEDILYNSSFDSIVFAENFYFHSEIHYIYIGEVSECRVEIAGCSCNHKRCATFSCNRNTVISDSKCNQSATLFGKGYETQNLKISGYLVEIFQYPFRWMDGNETWHLCDDLNLFKSTGNESVSFEITTTLKFVDMNF